MSGFLLDLVAIGERSYEAVKDILIAKSFRLLWSSTDDPKGAKDTGLIHGPKAILSGPGALSPVGSLSDLTVEDGEFEAGSAWINAPAHGLSLRQGDVTLITESDNSDDLGVYHLSGYNSGQIEVDRWLKGTTVSVEIYRDVISWSEDGRTKCQATIVDTGDGTEIAHTWSYYVNRGESTGRSLGLVIRPVGLNATDSGWGGSHFPFAIYRGLYVEDHLFSVDYHGITRVHKAMSIGKGSNTGASPDGIFDCTPTPIATDSYSYPFPRVTTTQRNALSGMKDGACCYDLTLHKLFVYETNAWVQK